MSISNGPVVGILKSDAEVKAELDAERHEARSPDRLRMFDDMPERLNDLEELLYLVRVDDFPTILGNRRYWLFQAMHEVQRLRNLAGENVRIKTRAPESLNGRPETEKYEYSRDMLKIFILKEKERDGASFDRLFLGSWWLLLAAVWCIVLALADFREAWIYDLSKWVLCSVFAYAGFQFWKERSRRLMVIFGIMAIIFGCPWNPVVFPSSDGEVEFAKEEQDPDAKGGERPQPPRIRDDPGNQ